MDFKPIFKKVKKKSKEILVKTNELFRPKSIKNRKVQPGDIVGVKRRPYYHYGIYCNDEEVIHYAPLKENPKAKNIIHITTLENFKGGKRYFFILNLDYLAYPNFKFFLRSNSIPVLYKELVLKFRMKTKLFKKQDIEKLYSPKETIKRAKSRLGEEKYNILTNNCEHFVVWCKTGITNSDQVRSILSYLPFIKTILK